MDHSPLAAVKQRLKIGQPVPFNIRNAANNTLLLARGQVLGSEAQLESLLERGAVVDMEELKGPRAEIFEAPPEELPVLWNQSIARIGRALRSTPPPLFVQTLNDAIQPLMALVDRDPDVAIFQIVRPEALGDNSYGVAHSVHCAIATYLVAKRLGWDQDSIDRVVKGALTMNLSILELQSRLALQTSLPSATQRASINNHPTRSADMLRAAGVTDEAWLTAVAQHHEVPGGKGYPNQCEAVTDTADMLRCVDMYTAKLSPRGSRTAIPANLAGRDLFMECDKTPIVAAVVKEFGIFPPGCFVTLQSGEVGVAIKRGGTASTPVVAALLGRNGEAMMQPVRRCTDAREHAVVRVVSESSLRIRVSPAKLAAMTALR
jgi:hypothetical protein